MRLFPPRMPLQKTNLPQFTTFLWSNNVITRTFQINSDTWFTVDAETNYVIEVVHITWLITRKEITQMSIQSTLDFITFDSVTFSSSVTLVARTILWPSFWAFIGLLWLNYGRSHSHIDFREPSVCSVTIISLDLVTIVWHVLRFFVHTCEPKDAISTHNLHVACFT